MSLMRQLRTGAHVTPMTGRPAEENERPADRPRLLAVRLRSRPADSRRGSARCARHETPGCTRAGSAPGFGSPKSSVVRPTESEFTRLSAAPPRRELESQRLRQLAGVELLGRIERLPRTPSGGRPAEGSAESPSLRVTSNEAQLVVLSTRRRVLRLQEEIESPASVTSAGSLRFAPLPPRCRLRDERGDHRAALARAVRTAMATERALVSDHRPGHAAGSASLRTRRRTAGTASTTTAGPCRPARSVSAPPGEHMLALGC